MKKRLMIPIIIILVILLLGCSTKSKEQNRVDIRPYYGFLETHLLTSECSDDEREIMNEYLANHYIESKGFFELENFNLDVFEKLYHSYKICEYTNSYELMDTIKELFYLCESNMYNFNIPVYDYSYYIALKSIYGEKVELEEYITLLNNFIDAENGLIFFLSPEDNIGLEILVTAKIVSLCDNYEIDIDKLQLKDKLKKIAENFEYKDIIESDTLYNSGGTIIYALNECGISIDINDKLYNWFSGWKNYYDRFEIKDYYTYSEYYSYYLVASYFETPNTKKIEEYLSKAEFKDCQLSAIYEYYILNYNDKLSDKQIDEIKDNVIGMINNIDNSMINDINFESTFYGCELAWICGFDIDLNKIRENLYTILIDNIGRMSIQDFVYNTHFYTMLMYNFDFTGITMDLKELINNKLDAILAEVSNQENIDIRLLRHILETKSYIAPYLYEDTYNKILGVLRNYSEEYISTCELLDVYVIDELLNSKVITSEFFNNSLQNIYIDGTYTSEKGGTADLIATYYVYSVLTTSEFQRSTSEDIENVHTYISSLYHNGLWSYEENRLYRDFRSIYYGILLEKLEIAEGKR